MRQKLDLDRLLVRIVEQLAEHEPSSLGFSKLAKLLDVPRTTLYYYFGSSLQKLHVEAARHGLKLFFGVFNAAPAKDDAPGWEGYQRARFNNTAQIVERYPWGPFLYFKYVHEKGPLGETLREWQATYLKTFAQRWKDMMGEPADPLGVKVLAAIKMGLLFGMAADPELRQHRELCVDIVARLSEELMRSGGRAAKAAAGKP
jgi:AcrR family transcriptional regulator